MPTLFTKDGKPLTVDDSTAATDLYLSGQAKVSASGQVPIWKDGKIETVAGKDLEQALASGMRLATDKEYKVAQAEARLEQETGVPGGPWWSKPAAAGLGLARGAVGFGIPDASLKGVARVVGGKALEKTVGDIAHDLTVTEPVSESLGQLAGYVAGSWRAAATAPAKVAGVAKAAQALKAAEGTKDAYKIANATHVLKKAEEHATLLASGANTLKRAMLPSSAIGMATGGVERLATQAASQILPGSGMLSRGIAGAVGMGTAGALEGAAMGASRALNDSEIYGDPVTAEKMWANIKHDALIGAKFGAAIGGARGVLDGALIKGSSKLYDLSDKRLIKELQATHGQVKGMDHLPGGTRGFANWLRENGLNGENLVEGVAAKKPKIGSAFDDIAQKFGQAKGANISNDELYMALHDGVKHLSDQPVWRKEYRAILEDINAIYNSKSSFSLNEAWQQRQSIDSKIRNIFQMPVGKVPDAAQAAKVGMRQGLEDLILKKAEIAAKELNDPLLVDMYKSTKMDYQYFKHAEKIADDLAAKQFKSTSDDMLSNIARAVGGAGIFGVKPAIGYIVGKGLLGNTGKIAGVAADSLHQLADYAAIRHAASTAEMSFQGALKAFVESTPRVRTKNPIPQDNSLEERYQKATELVKKLEAANPGDLIAQKWAKVAEASPKLAQNLTNTAVLAQQYLVDKMPKPPPLNTLQPQLNKAPIPDTQKHDFVLTYDAVNNPNNVLKAMANGTALPVQVQALKTVYPNMYAHMQQKLQEMAAAKELKGEAIPYAKQVQLSQIFGKPLDNSLDHAFVQKMQAIRNGSQQQQAKPQTQLKAPAQTGKAIATMTEMYTKNTQADRRMQ